MSIIIPIITEYMDGGVKNAQKSLKSLVSTQLTSTAAVTALVAAGGKAVKAYNEDVKSQKLLALTMRNTTGATDAQIKSTEDYLSRLSMQVAIADDELRPSLSNLLRITQDQTKAQTLLNDAVNIAAITQRPLEQVSLALGKAYQGNFKALKSMGLSISDTAIKSKDFEQVMREIRPVIEGAGVTAANSADGGMKKLKIAFDELMEAAGAKLSPVIEDFTVVATDLISKTKDADGKTSAWAGTLGKLGLQVLGLNGIFAVAKGLDLWSDKIQKANNATIDSVADFRKLDQMLMAKYNATLAKTGDGQDKLTTSLTKTKTATEKLADATKTKLQTALKDARQKVQDLKDESANLAGTIRDQVSGFVSLADAVDTSASAEDNYNQALKDRASAYAKLNALEAERQRRGFGPNDQVTYDANEYAQALLDVASAETAVSNAQSSRVNYSEKFASDIAAASQFAGKLKTLAERGLGQAGIQQLLNLGPVAGNQVANDLINGTGPMTLASLKGSLAGLAEAGQGLGDVTAGGVFGTAISGAEADVRNLKNAKVVSTTNNVTIQVTSADPQAVVDALKKWMKTNGSIPIKVKG